MTARAKQAPPTALALLYGLFFGYAAALVPAFVSIYNPHRYETDPLFMMPAVQNVLIAALIAVPLAWLFGRKWSPRLVTRIIVTGLFLTVTSAVLLAFAAGFPMREAGALLFAASLAATVAIPCVSLISVAITNKAKEANRAT